MIEIKGLILENETYYGYTAQTPPPGGGGWGPKPSPAPHTTLSLCQPSPCRQYL